MALQTQHQVSIKRMLGVGEAAELLGVSSQTLRHWSDEGCVPVYRTPGNQRRYLIVDLQSFMNSMRNFRRY